MRSPVYWRATARPFLTFWILFLILGLSWRTQATPFQVTTFSPWAGYAIPNGVWLTGDLNGDGKTDIIHAVQGRDYVHTWLSQGNGTFQIGTFRPWAGYAIPNGVWLVADINGDKRDDLVHVVQGKDYVHTWTSNGNGTFVVGTFRPWSGYAMPNGIWLTGDFNKDGRTDLFHAVQGKDYVHVWTSNGNGTFGVGTFRPWLGYAIPNGEWRTGDFNSDGRTDVVHIVKGADYVHTWTSNGNGTFAVSTFRPWAGYAMPNGVWMVGDYNGDKRDDLFHAVASADYAHTWLSNGNGTYNVRTYRPWNGYAIPNGLWMTGDFDGDNRADVVHAVQGSDYVHIWRSQGNGNYRVTTFSPWKGYAIPNGLWLTGDISGDGCMDIVHAVQGRDYVHPWISTLPKPGQVSLDGLEVTQSIQDNDQSVPLLSGKKTVARTYLSYNGALPITVRGVLYVYNYATAAWTFVNSTNTVTINPAQNDQLRFKREDINRSLNFELPSALIAQGWYYYRLGSVTITSSGNNQPCSDCSTTPLFDYMESQVMMRVRILGLRYQTGAPPISYTPSTLDYNLTRSWLRRAYPASTLSFSRSTINATATWPFNSGQANAQVAAVRALDVAGSTDNRTHYYGLVADGGGFMRGSAAGIPGSPDPTVVASGPTGCCWGWDTDGSYGDWYTGHELGHTYGRSHPGFCGESHSDPSYPYQNGQLSNADGAFVGFDVGDAAMSLPMRALPGVAWHDVMTYCDNQWLSAYTYNAIRRRLIDEMGLPAGAVPPFAPTAFAGTPETGNDQLPPPEIPNYPEISGSTVSALQGQPPVITGSAKAPRIKSLKSNRLVVPAPDMKPLEESKLTAQYGAFRSPQPDMRRRPVIQYTLNGSSKEALESIGKATSRDTEPGGVTPKSANGDFLNVVASINVTKRSGQLVATQRLAKGIATKSDDNGEVTIRLKDQNNRELVAHKAAIQLSTDILEGEDQTGIVNATLPWNNAASLVEIWLGSTLLDSRKLSNQAPVQEAPGASRKVAIAGVDEGSYEITWSASDPDGDSLTFHVQISTDGGTSWETIAYGLTETTYVFNREELPEEAKTVNVRVLASDGTNLTVVLTDKISLE